MEQLSTRDQQPADTDFTFVLSVVVGDLPNDPSNKVNNEIIDPIVKGVAVHDVEQQMEDNDDNTNDEYSRETDKSDYIGNYYNQFDNAYEVVPQEELSGAAYGRAMVEDVPLEEVERDEKVPTETVDPPESPQGGPSVRSVKRNMEVPHGARWRKSGRKCKPIVIYKKELQHIMSHFIMKKYTLKMGVKKSPQTGSEAAIKEMTQLHNRDSMDAMAYGSLTFEQKSEALRLVIFLKD